MPKTPKRYDIEDVVILTKIYPLVAEKAKTRVPAVKKCIEDFIHRRHEQLYDYAPIDRIFFRKQDAAEFFKAIDIKESVITSILPELYYWKDDELQACKDEFTLTCLMFLRYLLKERPSDTKMIELTYVYFAFSGKFYAACHYHWFRNYLPKREVMDYVVNYMLNQKFDLIKTKSVWGAVRNLSNTWVDTYKDELCGEITDERICYLLHQLHNRILAFLRNIAQPYYEAYKKKLYINAESDNYDEENYRIANNNSTIAATITEKTMTYMTSTQVNLSVCYAVSSSGVDPYEIKAIFENILSNNDHLDELRYVINVLLVDFAKNYPEEKEMTGPKFIAHSIKMKPNTKDPDIIRSKNYVLGWLNTSSRYKTIKTQATKNNYYKGILSYIAITVNTANKD